MEQRATDLEQRRATVSAFGELAAAMRAVAAARARQARGLIAGVDAYAATVAAAMAQATALLTAPPASPARRADEPPLWLLIGPEQGFNAGFGERLLDAAPEALPGRVLLLGTRLLRLAQARGCRPEWSAPMIAHADAAAATGDALHRALAQALVQRPTHRVELVGAELVEDGDGVERIVVRRHRLLPMETAAAAPPGPPPGLHLPPAQLLDALSVEYLGAQLVRAILHGHAAENLARLGAMGAAVDNVRRMGQALADQERLQRQEAITAEIVELAAALRGSARAATPRDRAPP